MGRNLGSCSHLGLEKSYITMLATTVSQLRSTYIEEIDSGHKSHPNVVQFLGISISPGLYASVFHDGKSRTFLRKLHLTNALQS